MLRIQDNPEPQAPVGEESGWPTDDDLEASITPGACSKQLWVSSVIIPIVIFSTSSWVYIWILDTTLQNSLHKKGPKLFLSIVRINTGEAGGKTI